MERIERIERKLDTYVGWLLGMIIVTMLIVFHIAFLDELLGSRAAERITKLERSVEALQGQAQRASGH